jgi:acyl carrier protein
MSQTVQRIRDFLIEELHWPGPRSELTEDLPLIANHVIDSMGLMRFVAWVESEFGVEIKDAEVVPANFGTIRATEALIAAKSQA